MKANSEVKSDAKENGKKKDLKKLKKFCVKVVKGMLISALIAGVTLLAPTPMGWGIMVAGLAIIILV